MISCAIILLTFATALPTLGALALGAQRLLPALQQSYFNWTLIRGGQSQLRDALELLNQPFPERMSKSQPQPIPFKKSIKLEIAIGASISI